MCPRRPHGWRRLRRPAARDRAARRLRFRIAAAKLGIFRIRMIFVAPGVELPGHAGALSVGPVRNVGPMSRAQESSSGTSKISTLPAVASLRFGRIVRAHGHRHRLECRDRAGDAREGLLGAQQSLRPAPHFRAARPAHPCARMLAPFRGHCIAVTRGARIVGVEPFGHACCIAVRAATRETPRLVGRLGRRDHGEHHDRKDRRPPEELGITLPTPPAPVASYVPYVISGKQVFISGQVTMRRWRAEICRHRRQGDFAGRRPGGGAAVRDQSSSRSSRRRAAAISTG